jgi:hypothetical protein
MTIGQLDPVTVFAAVIVGIVVIAAIITARG